MSTACTAEGRLRQDRQVSAGSSPIDTGLEAARRPYREDQLRCVAKPFPYTAFVGADQLRSSRRRSSPTASALKAPECTEDELQSPIGTGPFRVDRVPAQRRDHARPPTPTTAIPTSPPLRPPLFKGGGDAAAAARSVLETGEFDYAWNLQLAPDVIKGRCRLRARASRGLQPSARSVERIMVNLSDQRTPSSGRTIARSTSTTPSAIPSSPIKAVRQRAVDGRRPGQMLVEVGLRRRRQGDLQRAARTGGLRVHGQRRVPDAGHRRAPRRMLDARRLGRLGRRRRAREERRAGSPCCIRPRPTAVRQGTSRR